jgi:hypothetical protein
MGSGRLIPAKGRRLRQRVSVEEQARGMVRRPEPVRVAELQAAAMAGVRAGSRVRERDRVREGECAGLAKRAAEGREGEQRSMCGMAEAR